MIIMTQLSSGKVFKRCSSSAHVPTQLASRCATFRWLIVGGPQINNCRQFRNVPPVYNHLADSHDGLAERMESLLISKHLAFYLDSEARHSGHQAVYIVARVCVCVWYGGRQHTWQHHQHWHRISSPVRLLQHLLTCENGCHACWWNCR